MNPLTKQETKDAFKEACTEWLDAKAKSFGYWSWRVILGCIFIYLLKFLVIHGALNLE